MPSRNGAARNGTARAGRRNDGAAVDRKPWSFLVYMAGDNNLEQAGVDDLGEMKKVGTQDGVNVVAQFDRPSGATRYLLRAGTPLSRDVVATLGRQNTGDPQALVKFVEWAVKAYPSDRVALVLWNHGQGWDDTDIYARERVRDARRPRRIRRAFFRSSVEKAAAIQRRGGVVARAILLDDGAKDFIDNAELKGALAATRRLLGRKLDLLGMDACLMSMVEVGYQARGAVAFAVGSEETEPGDGWPYDAILRQLATKPSMGGAELGQVVVDAYLRSYRSGREAVTQSLCNLADAPRVSAAVKDLGAALTAALADPKARAAINDVRNRVQRYEVRDNVDLVDLCHLLQEQVDVPAPVKSAAEDVAGALLPPASDGAYVARSGWVGDTMKHSNGAAIYFPTEQVSPLYAKLDWSRATRWGGFLDAYVSATRGR